MSIQICNLPIDIGLKYTTVQKMETMKRKRTKENLDNFIFEKCRYKVKRKSNLKLSF